MERIRPTDQQIETLRQAAAAACVSVTEIAGGTGLSVPVVSKTMRGVHRKPSTVRAIARYLADRQATDPVPDLVTPEAERLEIRSA